MLRLHNYWRSSASYRVRIGLGLGGLAYEYVAVNLLHDGGAQKQAPYLAMNPMAQVPTLEVIDADGRAQFLSQSLPILEYLAEAHGAPLLPATALDRARTRALAEIVNAGIQPLQNLTTMRKVRELGGDDNAWAKGYIEDGLRAFAASLPSATSRFCVGETPSLADCCLIPQLFAARRFGASLEGLDRLLAIEAACAALPAFADAHPARQPDAVAG